ncbi:MAG: hypothetical protein QXX34_07775 [Candidatus Bathyarchaeia archaeon]
MRVDFKPLVVWLIQNGKAEEALALLAENYGVSTPKLKVGLPKGHRRNALGCYTAKNETIALLVSDVMKNPFVILHEFYHHLRTQPVDKQHRGTEKHADKFAAEFLLAYENARRMKRFGQA